MIIGIGTDIVEIKRIEEVIKRTLSFLDKAFTTAEIEYIKSKNNNSQTIAGMFSAKEAISKALGTGFRGFGLRDIEICHNSLGKPEVILGDKIKKQMLDKEVIVHLSISHSNDNATAFVVIEEV